MKYRDWTDGHIDEGTQVKFKIDGDTGIVIHSNPERSLVEYAASPESGCISERNWFDNDGLQIPKN